MDSYGIDIEDIENVIKNGMKWKENEEEKWHANMGGLECVFVKEEDYIFVITVYTEGAKK